MIIYEHVQNHDCFCKCVFCCMLPRRIWIWIKIRSIAVQLWWTKYNVYVWRIQSLMSPHYYLVLHPLIFFLCICWPDSDLIDLIPVTVVMSTYSLCMTIKAVWHKHVKRLSLWLNRGISHSCISLNRTEPLICILVMKNIFFLFC